MVAPVVIAAGIQAGASILGGAFGGGGQSTAKTKRNMRIAEAAEFRTTKRNYKRYTSIQARVRDAKKAGLHPLFAMGAGGSPTGGGSSFSIPGQSSGGSAKQRGLEGVARAAGAIGRHYSELDLIDAQNQAATLRLLEQKLSNDVTQTIPAINPAAQIVKKGEVDPYYKKNPERNLSVKSPMTQFRIGNQKIFLPIEDADQMMEDPAAVIAAAVMYQGNDHINWSQVWLDYTGDHKDLARRNPGAFKAGAKAARWADRKMRKGRTNVIKSRVDPRSPAHAPWPGG